MARRCSELTAWLARAAFVYVVASLVYLFWTRRIGTPFKDSLSEAQRAIKREAARQRGRIFGVGVGVGCATLAIFSPFSAST